jgi:hypothetical protein
MRLRIISWCRLWLLLSVNSSRSMWIHTVSTWGTVGAIKETLRNIRSQVVLGMFQVWLV